MERLRHRPRSRSASSRLAAVAGQPRHRPAGGVDVALDLGERDRPLGRPAVGVADRIARVLPALVEQPELASGAGTRRSRRRRGRRSARSSRAPPARSATAGRAARRRRSRRGSRRGGSARAASNRRCRSRRRAGVSPARAISPVRSSCRILPGSASCHGSSVVACRRARTSSVATARVGMNATVSRAAIRLSRPNSVANHGMPGRQVLLARARTVVAQRRQVDAASGRASGRAARGRSGSAGPRSAARRLGGAVRRRLDAGAVVAAGATVHASSSLTGPADRQALAGLELRGPAGDDARAGPDLGVVDRLERGRPRGARSSSGAPVEPVVGEHDPVVVELDRAGACRGRSGGSRGPRRCRPCRRRAPSSMSRSSVGRRVALDHDLLAQAAVDPARPGHAELAPGRGSASAACLSAGLRRSSGLVSWMVSARHRR